MKDKKERAALLKRLRGEHAETVKQMQALLKEQKKIRQSLCQNIRETSKTVPEIAAAVDMPTHEVLWYLTAFKKYDIVVEDGMCGDYILYKRAEEN